VQEIMRTIEHFNAGQNAVSCPECLRDTMLRVAALLHLQTGQVESPGEPEAQDAAEFAEAATGRLADVKEAAAGSTSSRSKH
jgi:hypothetical protein